MVFHKQAAEAEHPIMFITRKANERGHENLGWLDTYHTFAFGEYFDPKWIGYRSLRVLNDDLVMPGAGFGMHPHRDMEILTYVLSGAVEHRDSMGNGGVIHAGELQYMSAGTGVLHSEFNPSKDEPLRLLQIWIVPEAKDLAPRYEDSLLEGVRTGNLHLLTSKTGRDGSIAIRQDADLWLAKLDAGQAVSHTLAKNRHAWIHVAEGGVAINGAALTAGDGAAINGGSTVEVSAAERSQVLLFDLN